MISNEAILFYVACLAAFLTLIESFKKILFIKNAERTKGEIVGIGTVSSSSDHGSSQQVNIKFYFKDIEYFMASGLFQRKTSLGVIVPIIFDGTDPRKSYVDSFFGLFFFRIYYFCN